MRKKRDPAFPKNEATTATDRRRRVGPVRDMEESMANVKIEKAPRTMEQNMGTVMRALAACPVEQRATIVRAVLALYAPRPEA